MVFKKVSRGYIGFVEDLPGANTQGRTLAETRQKLRQAIRQVLDTNRQLAEEVLRGEEVIREPLSLASL
jgi:predicted RNase H-like HicB family nuclease